ncbi:thioredoxin domain-containing protein [Mesorhizobium sp. BR1-1-16]|uniref:thioredoxin domain-containing protein n=1 Tax=Mesorhizobium sp. BR1-1-16 TaxID=2876653 RepID=UPI001CCCBE99|nr:thioredoxin domain-containing protein [Mesorhizobium sp. BR1-1-16]MBZ9938017.1 thioredoxin domain-containing protein [Mesorhizobium sp. BR1-1-16]
MSDNRLRHEKSPYLLQHADNPVDWRPWGPAALDEAKETDKPILLSIGYAACHWCHVMAHESFEHTETAALMNALFVNIKVDREQRPDIDQLYMAALHALGDQGGWPLTMFLTPDGKPIWGGTYFPRDARYGRPGFADVLRQIAALYRNERTQILEQADKITAHIAAASRPTEAGQLDAALLDRATDAILGIMDPGAGGTRGAPKFPNAPVLGFLAGRAEGTNRPDLTTVVSATLLGLCNGGIYDHVGGGLARYSTDARWLVPHFEKMLYDNAMLIEQLALALPRAGRDADLFRSRIEETIAWMQRELQLAGGGFAAGLDADSDGEEGLFYVWQRDEIERVLGKEEADFLSAIYDITETGNWEGRTILNRLSHPERLSAQDEARCRRVLDTLRRHRETRPRPSLDDQALTDWNALAITGLATAGFRLQRPDWVDLARTTYAAIVDGATDEGRLRHVASEGPNRARAFATDLAGLARAAIALHQATRESHWLAEAGHWLDDLDRHNGDGAGGFYLAPDDGDVLIVRKRDRLDEATPNAHGIAAEAHVRLWALTGNDHYRAKADAILAGSAATIRGNVFGTASLLSALDLRLNIRSLVVIVPEDATADALLDALRAHGGRHLVVDWRAEGAPLPEGHPAFGKGTVGGKPTAYLCREGSCSLPVTDAAALAALLERGVSADQVFI